MNHVSLIGNITRDIELRYSQSGMAIASFGIAINKKVKNQSGGYDDQPQYFDITAFKKTAENINQYFRKGAKIGISGELNFESWVSQEGQKRSKVSVICHQFDFIDKKQDDGQGQQGGYNAPQQQQSQGGYNAPQQQQQQTQYQAPQQKQQQQMPADLPSIDIDEDEIPF